MELSLAWQITREGSWGKKKKKRAGLLCKHKKSQPIRVELNRLGRNERRSQEGSTCAVCTKKTHKRGSENGAASFAFLCYSIEDKMFLKNSRG